MVWVRVFTRSSRCSTTARKAVVAASIWAVPSAGEVSAAIPTDSASASSFLRPCPLESTRTRAASLAATSMTSMPSVRSSVVSGAPSPAAPSIAQWACGQRCANRRSARNHQGPQTAQRAATGLPAAPPSRPVRGPRQGRSAVPRRPWRLSETPARRVRVVRQSGNGIRCSARHAARPSLHSSQPCGVGWRET
jgi:hypothetical protein